MGENRHEEGGKRDTVVGVIKETGVHSNFTSRSLMHGGIGAGQLRMDLLGDKIFSTNGIKVFLLLLLMNLIDRCSEDMKANSAMVVEMTKLALSWLETDPTRRHSMSSLLRFKVLAFEAGRKYRIKDSLSFALLVVLRIRRSCLYRVVYDKVMRKKKDKSIVAFHLIRTPSFPAITAHHVDSQVLYANQYINEDVHSHVHNVSALTLFVFADDIVARTASTCDQFIPHVCISNRVIS
ncbi:hypothetical protein Tco_0071642 [Tanacetum coccineum]